MSENKKQAPVAEAAVQAQTDPFAEKETIELFKDSGKYKSDVFVCVNGKRIQIQRGKKVEIPKPHYEVLRNSMEQDKQTAELISRETGEFEKKVKALNI